MITQPSVIINIQSDLCNFAKLCKDCSYKPTEEEIKQIIDYLLIIQNYSSNGTMTESFSFNDLNKNTLKFLYESFNNILLERGEGIKPIDIGNVKDFITSLLGKTSGGESFSYISFIFKKSKINSILKKIDTANNRKLDYFKKLVDLEEKLSKLKRSKKGKSNLSSYIPTYE